MLTKNSNNTETYWNAEGGTTQYFRIVALDTQSLAPILPAIDTSFGFNSTLVNWGNGPLSQEISIIQNITTTYTSAYKETIGLSSLTTASIEVSYFGTGDSITGEVSTSLEIST